MTLQKAGSGWCYCFQLHVVWPLPVFFTLLHGHCKLGLDFDLIILVTSSQNGDVDSELPVHCWCNASTILHTFNAHEHAMWVSG